LTGSRNGPRPGAASSGRNSRPLPPH